MKFIRIVLYYSVLISIHVHADNRIDTAGFKSIGTTELH